ncbi:MAG TPA: VOC family protein [Candidatus Dormibacteraeota bacterium]|nr:VOC family protein [Candidatus Dormibacteraeota bacterium]
MIGAVHTILYAQDAEVARAFFRDVLGFDSVDGGGGWLSFALPPAELAIHPDPEGGRAEVFLMCKDLRRTKQELQARGVEFVGDLEERRFGLMARIKVPGFGELGLYQPSHPSPIDLD